ncbi:MAG: HPr family phosphocarrier protein [Candidatus Krumholzibacteria bacterium]|nr:HPr family phosphocarrier protein [Candidatus Krumholzibacteria bacterium]
MVSGSARVKNKNGIHLRLAGELVKAATRFKSQITVSKDGQEVDAKSILGVAGLGAECGAELLFSVDGEDEGQALEYLIDLIDNQFAQETG